MRETWQWIKAGVSAAVVLIIALVFYGRRKAAGDSPESLRADRDRLREAEETGDDIRVLNEWRRR